MELGDILASDGILQRLKADTKKQALEGLAAKAEKPAGIVAVEIYNALLQRERLGSTGLGRGIAVPHVKFKDLKKIICLFARLEQPIEFESPDGEPVDLIFLLMSPEHASGDHLKSLARISRLVREPALLERLRNAPDTAALNSLLTSTKTSHAA